MFTKFPLLQKELIENAASKRLHVLRILYGAIVYIIFLQSWINIPQNTFEKLGSGSFILRVVYIANIACIMLLVPIFCANIITSEKERNTLPLLLICPLGVSSVLLQKLASLVLISFSFVMMSLPISYLAYTLGGVTEEQILLGILAQFLTIVQVGAFGFLFASYHFSSIKATIYTYIGIIIVYLLLPLFSSFLIFPDFDFYTYSPPFLITGGSFPGIEKILVILGVTIFFLMGAVHYLKNTTYIKTPSKKIKPTNVNPKLTAPRAIVRYSFYLGMLLVAYLTMRGNHPEEPFAFAFVLIAATTLYISWRPKIHYPILWRECYLNKGNIKGKILFAGILIVYSCLPYGYFFDIFRFILLWLALAYALIITTMKSFQFIYYEKQKQTLVTLLATPMSTYAILTQKMLALTLQTLHTALILSLILSVLGTQMYQYYHAMTMVILVKAFHLFTCIFPILLCVQLVMARASLWFNNKNAVLNSIILLIMWNTLPIIIDKFNIINSHLAMLSPTYSLLHIKNAILSARSSTLSIGESLIVLTTTTAIFCILTYPRCFKNLRND